MIPILQVRKLGVRKVEELGFHSTNLIVALRLINT